MQEFLSCPQKKATPIGLLPNITELKLREKLALLYLQYNHQNKICKQKKQSSNKYNKYKYNIYLKNINCLLLPSKFYPQTYAQGYAQTYPQTQGGQNRTIFC